MIKLTLKQGSELTGEIISETDTQILLLEDDKDVPTLVEIEDIAHKEKIFKEATMTKMAFLKTEEKVLLQKLKYNWQEQDKLLRA